VIILGWNIKANIPAGTRDTAGTGRGLYAVSKFGNRTRTRATRFGNTAGITVPVAKPTGRPEIEPIGLDFGFERQPALPHAYRVQDRPSPSLCPFPISY